MRRRDEADHDESSRCDARELRDFLAVSRFAYASCVAQRRRGPTKCPSSNVGARQLRLVCCVTRISRKRDIAQFRAAAREAGLTGRQRRVFSKQHHKERSGRPDLSYQELVEEMRRFREEHGNGNS
jgi:hypothetical protein